MRLAHPLVHRWALVRTGDPTEADDLTQDVLVQVIRKLDSFEGSARFSTWLYTVTRNAAADRFRGARRHEEIATADRARSLVGTPAGQDPERDLERRQLADVIEAFFLKLPDRQREVFDLVELQELTSVEAGERLGIDPVSVRVSLMKARRTLREKILEAHPELTEGIA